MRGREKQRLFSHRESSLKILMKMTKREQKLVCPSLLQCTARPFPPAPVPSSYAGRAGRKYKAIRQ